MGFSILKGHGEVTEPVFIMEEKMKTKINHDIQRVVALLERNQVDYLDRIGKDALFSEGHKLSRTKIISYLVDFIKSIHMTGFGIGTEEDFIKRIIKALEKNHEHC